MELLHERERLAKVLDEMAREVTPVQPPAPPLVARSYSTLEFTPEVLHGDEDEEVDASRGARRGR